MSDSFLLQVAVALLGMFACCYLTLFCGVHQYTSIRYGDSNVFIYHHLSQKINVFFFICAFYPLHSTAVRLHSCTHK